MTNRTWLLIALAAAGCSKKPADEKITPGSATPGSGSAVGSGSGSASAAVGSGSASAAVGSGGSAAAGGGSGSDTAATSAALVERGEYLSNMLACAVCHTPVGPQGPDFKKAWAGGLEMPEKFGTWRSPNITMDKGTGIGNWTDAQILDAIREGKRPDGSGLLPVMPYLNYNRLTDDDGKALVAYMRTLPAIENVVAPNKDLKLAPIPAPKPANEPDVVADPVKHGEYMATLMHCNACHTPQGPKGPDLSKAFAGGLEMELPMLGKGILYASNITSDVDTGIGSWTEAQIAETLKSMIRPSGKPILGPMMFYQGYWSRLVPADFTALATYVKRIPAIKNKVPASTFTMNMAGGPPPDKK